MATASGIPPYDPASARPDDGPATGSPWIALAGALALAAAYLWLMRSSFTVQPGDEATYVYDGLLVSRGFLPYRDFFLAHPPLRVLATGLLTFLGAPPDAVKSLAPLAFAGTGVVLAFALRPRLGTAASLLASFLFLFSTLALQTGGSLVGTETVALLMAVAIACAARGRFLSAGLAVSLASVQALYAVLPVPVLVAWAWRERRLKHLAAGLAPGALAWAGLGVAFGMPFVEQTFLYQARKIGTDVYTDPLANVRTFLVGDAGIVAFALAGLLARAPALRWTAVAGLFAACVTAAYTSVMPYYFVVSLPLLALAAASGVREIGLRARGRSRPARVLLAGALVAAGLVTYLPHFLDAANRHANRLAEAREMSALSASIARCRPASNLLWGDRALAPLMALRTGMDLAAREVDTDDRRFTSGLEDPAAYLARVFVPPLPAVLLVEDQGVHLIDPLRDYVKANYVPVFGVRGKASGFHSVYWLSPADAERGAGCAERP